MDAEIAALRPGLATGNVQLATNTECVRICVNSSGSRATGAVLRQDGAEYVINAEVIAVCAGVERTAALLRRSRTDKHPEGLGNNTGCLGRYLAGHAVGTVFPLISWRKLPPMHTKTFAINSYYHGGSDWPYPLGVVQATGQMPFWKEASLIVRPFARSIGVRSIMCFYMAEALPTHQSRLTFSGERVVGRVEPTYNLLTFDRLRRTARDLFRGAGYWTIAPKQLPSLWHFVGTARMGTDPSISVVDPCCQVHGIKQLFVIDASVLPSAGSVNTALTIIALALRAGDFIASGKLVTQAVPRTSLQPGPISSQPLYIH
jgi:choline dehydrogenase-like flavoprotein